MQLAIAKPFGRAWRGSARRAEYPFGLRALPVVTESAAAFPVDVAGGRFGTRRDGGRTCMRTAKQTERNSDRRP